MSRNPPSDFWLNCARAGMELCWLAAWINYFCLMIFSAPYPWHNALTAFGGAGLAMWLGRRGKRRVYQVGLIHLTLMAAALLWGLHSFYGQGAALWDPAWLRALANADLSGKDVLILALVIIFSLLFWLSGCYWYKRERDYGATSRSFDRGMSALLGLFGFKFLLWVRFETQYPDQFGLALLIAFFLFALPALARSRSRNRAELAGRISGSMWSSSLGILLTFMLLAGGTASFYLPYFNQAAQAGYLALEKTLSPLGPYVVAILRFLFAPRSSDRKQPAQSQDGRGLEQAVQDADMPIWLEIITYVLGGLLVLSLSGLLLILLVLAVRHLFRWLSSSAGQRPEQPPLWQELLVILQRIWLWTARRLLGMEPGLAEAVLMYYRLKKWGRRSGLTVKPGETPREYGDRLAGAFPELAGELDAVIQAHEQAVYASRPGQTQTRAGLRRRTRRLASPAWWPRRLKLRWQSSRQN